jgi:cytochrome c-type biogenesis protein CcmH
MGWIILLLLALGSLALLWTLGVRRGLLTAGAAALLVGASGYALQGSPNLPDAPAVAGEGHEFFPLTDARHAFFATLPTRSCGSALATSWSIMLVG